MVIQTNKSVIDRVVENTNDHDCLYGKRLVEMSRRSDVPTYSLSHLANQLVDMHTGGECPPTHVGINPTLTWSEWVKDTHFH